MRERSAQVAAYLGRHPLPNLLMTLTRNKNQNFVCYQAVVQRQGGTRLAAADPVAVFWMDIEPSYQKAARAAGRDSDRCELSMLERRLAYGMTTAPCGARASASPPTEFKVSIVALPTRTFLLRLVDGTPRVVGTIATQRAVLQRVHVNERERFLMTPAVDSVFLVGNSLADGRLVQEEIKP